MRVVMLSDASILGIQKIKIYEDGGVVTGKILPMVKIGRIYVLLDIQPSIYKSDVFGDALIVHSCKFSQGEEKLIEQAQAFISKP